MMADPHALIEGIIIASYAIRAQQAFIYVRGEVVHAIRRLHHAVDEAYEAGYLGENILGSGFDLDIVVHAGAGAYICGEETALLDSLEGFRGQPRLKPPFPAIAGLYACPTVVNNVETIASVPCDRARRRRLVRARWAPRSRPGSDLLAVRPRHQARPVRGPAGHHAARAARPGRRHARRAPAEVLDARRVVHAAAHRRAPGRAAGLRGRRRGRVDARHPARSVLRRDHCVVRVALRWWSSTSTSPAASARRAGRAPTGWSRS